ncbi:uncharacterized protein LOC124631893 [Helicoverpa zea]|uniref:uncharacterized protein LOC124631893 n=1 Tax=Helicoverpa zea TaxID=7113 RepID=UPI001F5AD6EA|nr:uncharacterized protein LOC124631893 [Helicoverpa zea]
MEDLVIYQLELLDNLKNAEKNYKKTPKDRIKRPYLETRLEMLEELWNNFKDGHKKIVLSISSDEQRKTPYFKEKTYEVFQELYVQYKSSMKETLQPFLDAAQQASTPSTTEGQGSFATCSDSNEIKLPRINIPTFSGKYDEWQTFYDLFTTLIHKNTKLSPVHKLHYLKSSLKGEPEVILRNYTTTNANYTDAWNELILRYNNKRYNCKAILRTFISQKSIHTESASCIRHLLDTSSTCLKSLKNLDVDTDTWDLIITFLIEAKLDPESVRLWEQQLSTSKCDIPTWPDLRNFLESRYRSLEMIEANKTKTSQPKPVAKPKSFHANVTKEGKEREVKCVLCGDQHYIYHCKAFAGMSTKERQESAKKNKLCFNCLAPSHSVNKCRQSACCKRCGRRHHSLLHFEREENAEKSNEGTNTTTGTNREASLGESSSSINAEHIVSNFSTKHVQTNTVLLATAKVLVNSKNGCKHIIRALLDQGSQASFVSEATVQLLNLTRVSVSGWVSGVGEGQTKIKHMVSLCVKSRHNPNESIRINAYVLRTLTTLLPTSYLTFPDWLELQGLDLADPGFTTPGKIDILLGAEVYGNVLLDGIIRHPEGNLVAQNTILGWVVSGRTTLDDKTGRKRITTLHAQINDDDLLRQFWEIEREPNNIKRKFSKEEEMCEEFYDATTVRDETGRFVVRLPFQNEEPECKYGGLREIAIKRFECLERKLSKNPKLQDEYRKVMDEYLKLNHMVEITPSEIDKPAVYLPHHAVLREDKLTTKLRVVFDASCKGTNNVALNDNLCVGPQLQQELRHILMRWRTHRICITSDIIKMYRMVRVSDADTDYQRLVWRSSPDEPIKHFKLLRLTFGTACAPYLAVKSLQTLAKEGQSIYPIAAQITMSDYYMDDLLSGCDTEEHAVEIYHEMNSLMNSGGFQLQKWSSNSEAVLQYIGKNNCDDHELPLKVNSVVKVLGVNWNRETDSFEYTVNLPEPQQPVTKRTILSEIAKLYDPLGWIAPVVVVAKMIMQKLWKTGLEWDEPIDGVLLAEWNRYRENLAHIKGLSIPRWLHYSNTSSVELHVFADASQVAYGAVVYMRVVDEERVYVSLITSKTKVAPIEKQVSIPRLEICGAALAAKLILETSQVICVPKSKLFAWTDSTIVLAWLKGGPSRWNTFVSNRVSDILNTVDYEQWGHVSTDMNPADCASRGLQGSELLNHSLWWNGPTWLSNLNMNINVPYYEDTHEEERTRTLTAIYNTEQELIWTKFSSLSQMLRVISYCRRFLNFKLPVSEREHFSKFITSKELSETLNNCIRSKLRNLCPIVDNNGILRVGGRIQKSEMAYDTQHQIILPANSHLTRLIIKDAHFRTMHGGPLVMLNYLRSKYWILRAKDLTKKLYRECITCIRYSKKNITQLMGQLPDVRVKADRAFKSSGVDYAGPINIRFSPGRGAKSYKGYICLFICMVTRAIHLEAVTDMTAKAFIAAFRRFTSRRGHCHDVYSDNGTNFVGADRQLRDMFNSAKSSIPGEIAELLVLERTTWHYIPPHAPNFGGLWEAGIRSTKTHLKKVIGDATLTYEELTTVLAQVEACLNSRPITVLSDDPNDPLPLTPGHFLIGEPLLNLSDENYTNCNISSLDRWRLTQKMVNDFWNRWHKEYLVNLNQRYKWNTKQSEPDIDDIVILKEDNIPPSKWILGKIIKKHVGPDGITRVVSIKCKNGVYKRPVSKLCILPKNAN